MLRLRGGGTRPPPAFPIPVPLLQRPSRSLERTSSLHWCWAAPAAPAGPCPPLSLQRRLAPRTGGLLAPPGCATCSRPAASRRRVLLPVPPPPAAAPPPQSFERNCCRLFEIPPNSSPFSSPNDPPIFFLPHNPTHSFLPVPCPSLLPPSWTAAPRRCTLRPAKPQPPPLSQAPAHTACTTERTPCHPSAPSFLSRYYARTHMHIPMPM